MNLGEADAESVGIERGGPGPEEDRGRARRRQLSQMAEVAVRLFAGILRRREQAGGMTSSKNHG